MKILAIILLLSISGHADESNSIDKEAVRKIIRKNLASFKKCYDNEVNDNPDIGGKVVLSWDISDTGELKTANIKSSDLKNLNAEECIVSTVKTLKFPEAAKGTTINVSYPFVFANNISGFKVVSLEKGSIYEQLGFKKGDIIKMVNNKPIKNTDDANGIFDQLKNPGKIEIQFLRNGKLQKIFYDIK
jgi:C-terminal processing protease CtpA/Prc